MALNAKLVKTIALDAGFDLVGVCSTENFAELDYFPSWISAGYAGDMSYLEAKTDAGALKRSSLEHVAPWANSVIVCALNYNSAPPYSTQCTNPSRGWISRYAWSKRDYHDVLIEKLRKVESRLRIEHSDSLQTRCYVDTGPLIERVFAQHAGVGWTGKNTCTINQQLGSWLFLGVILTSLPLTPDIPAADRCGTCTRCLDACPTNAFIGPHQLDATRCISYLTIEKRGAVAEDLRDGMGRHLFGCDICQDVCPWNRRAPTSTLPEFAPRNALVNPPLEWIATMSVEEFRENFRGSPVKRAKYSGLRRNAAIAMGNSGDPRFVPVLEELCRDEDTVVAEHARWALEKIRHLPLNS